jgi:hypothetical protein
MALTRERTDFLGQIFRNLDENKKILWDNPDDPLTVPIYSLERIRSRI